MNRSDQKIVQYLNEAHASEVGLVSVLKSQIAMTPRGSYRAGLEKHLDETRTHARRIQERLGELEGGRDPLQAMLGFSESLIAQTVALSKAPFDLLRGSGGEEKVLKNAKDAYATEALEIVTYTALERLASNVGDERTAKLAATIRREEERMLERIMREIPKLTDAVVAGEIGDDPSYDITKTGAADATRGVANEATHVARQTETRARRTARQTSKVRGGAQAEGQLKGAGSSAQDLPIARYDSLTAEEVVSNLPALSQVELSRVDAYERANDARTTVLGRITALRWPEPWPGYDELTVAEIEAVIGEGDEQRSKDVVAYERSHKNRSGVIKSAQRDTASV
jgi:ferritin-like metal-binding protein YciE